MFQHCGTCRLLHWLLPAQNHAQNGIVHTNNCLNAGGNGGPSSKFATLAFGTDCIDCGPRVSMPSPPPRPPAGYPAPSLPPSICSDPCFYTSDAACDHGGFGYLVCAYGTDCTSCREHPQRRHEHGSRRHERAPSRAVVSTQAPHAPSRAPPAPSPPAPSQAPPAPPRAPTAPHRNLVTSTSRADMGIY